MFLSVRLLHSVMMPVVVAVVGVAVLLLLQPLMLVFSLFCFYVLGFRFQSMRRAAKGRSKFKWIVRWVGLEDWLETELAKALIFDEVPRRAICRQAVRCPADPVLRAQRRSVPTSCSAS